MLWYHWMFLISVLICLSFLLFHLVRLIRLGASHDYSTAKGNIKAGIIYSLTGAMSPVKKETAFLHLPTYAAGVVYHLGTFTCIILLLPMAAGVVFRQVPALVIAVLLWVSTLCGAGILVKRVVKKGLRELSNPDDYLSNILVTIFQFLTGLAVLNGISLYPALFCWAAILLLYIPLGKLKHLLYFFAARWQLGLFYGRRGVWPPQKQQSSRR